jgi:hypothetical protein
MPPSLAAVRLLALLAAVLLCPTSPAFALDKQGAAHGGAASSVPEDEGFGISGALMLGISLYNPTYAARPDNTGLALMRYAGHADVDLIGHKLSIPIDVNMFSDKEKGGLHKLSPSELDLIVGLTTTWDLGPGEIESGARVEQDRAVDNDSPGQTYGDVRLRYITSLRQISNAFATRHPHSNVSGWATLGWFAYNKTYFARPDNTGLALFRYGLHGECSLYDGQLAIAVDATMFTDKQAENVLRPSELDLTPEIIARRDRFELHLAYERDMPIDRSGLIQHFVYLLGAWGF